MITRILEGFGEVNSVELDSPEFSSLPIGTVGVVTAIHSYDWANLFQRTWYELCTKESAVAALLSRDWCEGPYAARFYIAPAAPVPAPHNLLAALRAKDIKALNEETLRRAAWIVSGS